MDQIKQITSHPGPRLRGDRLQPESSNRRRRLHEASGFMLDPGWSLPLRRQGPG